MLTCCLNLEIMAQNDILSIKPILAAIFSNHNNC